MLPRSHPLGACSFELYILNAVPLRVEYSIEVIDARVNRDFVFTRIWPQFLEANMPLIPKDHRDSLLASLTNTVGDFEAGRPLATAPAPDHGEIHAFRFTPRLLLGRRMYIKNEYKDLLRPRNPVSVYDAVKAVASWTFVLGLSRLPKVAADELKFFLAYGLAKWRRKGFPRLFPWRFTWDFAEMDRMILEYRGWHPESLVPK